MTARIQGFALAAILAVFATIATLAMRHDSATFDEILFPSAGARGYETGHFNVVLDHPPLMQYVYGLPVYLSHPKYPKESAYKWGYRSRYLYAQTFFWEIGNDPEKLLFRARLMGVLMGMLLIGSVYFVGRAWAGPQVGLLAALLIAFIPDVLAHSGISYNDVPLALATLLATFALDRAVRMPSIGRVALAGLAGGLTIAVKFSGIIIGPILITLVVAEALSGRARDRNWWLGILRAIPIFVLVLYATLVVVYRGDVFLKDFWWGLFFNFRHAEAGHGAPAVLLGHRSLHGWWYFFPVVFLLKTSAALHILLVIALYGGARVLRHANVTLLAGGPLRAAFIAGAGFLASTMVTHLNIGFRHALPVLPFACILIAYGLVLAARAVPHAWRFIVPLLIWHTLAPMRVYPYFLSYLSEYTGPMEESYDTLVDSSLDWGQGLLALREWMQQNHVDRIYLSYFGSALPAGYSIKYVDLPSFFPLPHFPLAPGETPPKFVAISGTQLAGNYMGGPFPKGPHVKPVAVVARSMWIYVAIPE